MPHPRVFHFWSEGEGMSWFLTVSHNKLCFVCMCSTSPRSLFSCRTLSSRSISFLSGCFSLTSYLLAWTNGNLFFYRRFLHAMLLALGTKQNVIKRENAWLYTQRGVAKVKVKEPSNTFLCRVYTEHSATERRKEWNVNVRPVPTAILLFNNNRVALKGCEDNEWVCLEIERGKEFAT